MLDRGVIRNRERATQIRDFSGLRFGNITPTDIDACIEYRNKGFVFIESKYGNAILPFGQRLALERLIDALAKPAILLIGRHEIEGDVDYAGISVTDYYFNNIWRKPTIPVNMRQAIEGFIARLEKDK